VHFTLRIQLYMYIFLIEYDDPLNIEETNKNISFYCLVVSGHWSRTSPALGANPDFQEALKISPDAYASWGLKIITFIWLIIFVLAKFEKKRVDMDLSGVQKVMVKISYTFLIAYQNIMSLSHCNILVRFSFIFLKLSH